MSVSVSKGWTGTGTVVVGAGLVVLGSVDVGVADESEDPAPLEHAATPTTHAVRSVR
ncbi:MAG: hypothetical protein JWN62_614 [Acidimicrobiales bacterium]|nr:hypothetical protein [Acidimicrobiales bacterium]